MRKSDCTFTRLNEEYNAFDFYEEKLENNFLEFTLEELGMPSAEELYDKTLKIVDEIGGIRGWRKVPPGAPSRCCANMARSWVRSWQMGAQQCLTRLQSGTIPLYSPCS